MDLKIDNRVFKEIFKNLYYPNSPYEFSVISPEILGNIYEQFLGKVIRLTPKHQAKVEEKPEVKKAGGVFYTPQYIVEYIVKNTIGELLKKGKTPKKVSKLRFVDPACGSGSFLLGAYQYLLDWHLDYYTSQKRPPKDVIYQGKDGEYRLTIQEKKRILLNNIYGVDSDTLAVEVTKLSLLLKVLEGENKDVIEQQQKLFQERALPNLGNNIKCGNSLVTNSMLEDCDFDINRIIELNPFNWEKEFPEIFNNGGFDTVIGNPPYVKENKFKEAFDGLRDSPYYQGKMDLWYLFGCKALDLVKSGGLVSFIATNNWITSYGASNFRNKVNTDATIKLFVDFGNYKVFETASIQTMIYVMKKDNSKLKYSFNYSKLLEDKITKKQAQDFLYNKKTSDVEFIQYKSTFDRNNNRNNYFNFVEENLTKILDKISNYENVTYLNKSEVSTGIDVHQDFLNKQGSNKIGLPVGSGVFIISDTEKNNLNLCKNEVDLIKPYYTTEEIKRYYSDNNNKYYVIYTKSDINKNINQYPHIKNHLDKFKEVITSSNKPYGLHRARKEEIFKGEKIIVTRKCSIPTFSYVPFDSYVSQTFMIIKTDRFDSKYLTGVLNSKLIQFWLKYEGKMQGNNYQLDKEPLLKIPLILTNNNEENKLIRLVDSMLMLNEELFSSTNQNQKRIISDQMELKENKVNQLVYDLYGLTPEEIRIIEDSLKE